MFVELIIFKFEIWIDIFMLKGAIFDLDGVIVDTVPLHFASWRYLFTDVHGISFTQEDYDERVDGKPRLDSIHLLLPHLNAEQVHEASETKQRRYLELLNEKNIPQFASSITLIKELHAKNIILGGASSSKNAKYILEKIGLLPLFSTVTSGFDLTHGKPHPEIFLKTAKNLNLAIDECIVFEDALAGVQSAKAGGFICIGIDRNNKPDNYIGADLVVKDLSEVNYTILENLLK